MEINNYLFCVQNDSSLIGMHFLSGLSPVLSHNGVLGWMDILVLQTNHNLIRLTVKRL